MQRLAILLLSLALVSCGGAEPAGEAGATTESAAETASETSTASGYVENVTRAQKKAHEMAAEEEKRVEEVDEAMKDQ